MSIYSEIKEKHGAGPAYPRKTDFTTVFGYAKGKLIGTFDTADAANRAGAATTEKNVDEDAYKAARDAYLAHDRAITDEWIARMRADCPFGDKIWDAIYAMAYEDGHSAGYGEVELYIDKYTEFAWTISHATIHQFIETTSDA